MSLKQANETAGRLLSRQEAAAYLGVKPGTLASWHTTGRYNLPVIHVGRLPKYRLSDLERWLEGRSTAPVE